VQILYLMFRSGLEAPAARFPISRPEKPLNQSHESALLAGNIGNFAIM
jgi:hypothetical protein